MRLKSGIYLIWLEFLPRGRLLKVWTLNFYQGVVCLKVWTLNFNGSDKRFLKNKRLRSYFFSEVILPLKIKIGSEWRKVYISTLFSSDERRWRNPAIASWSCLSFWSSNLISDQWTNNSSPLSSGLVNLYAFAFIIGLGESVLLLIIKRQHKYRRSGIFLRHWW